MKAGAKRRLDAIKKKKDMKIIDVKSRGDRRCPLSFLVISAFTTLRISPYIQLMFRCVFHLMHNASLESTIPDVAFCLHASSKALEHHTFVDGLVCHAVVYDLRPS